MKKLYTLILSVLLSAFAVAQLNTDVYTLISNKDFFGLEKKISEKGLDAYSRDYAQALVYNAFGEYEKSILTVEKWKSAYKPGMNDSIYQDLMNCNVDNYYKLSRFSEAADATSFLLKNFSKITNEEEVKDLKNTFQIWNGLRKTAAQQVEINGSSVISFKRDMAKLINVDVKHKGGTTAAVFDTGANISVASESTAKSMDLNIVAENVAVKAITGNEVMAKIGVAKEIKIGEITVKNAYFLVFSDVDLSFGGGVYKIDLIVGFPVIAGLGEIAFDLKAQTITINKVPAVKPERNMYVDGLTPIVQIKYKNHPLLLSFDSGADHTMFYEKFYTLVKDDKTQELTPAKSTIGGAGGTKTIDIMVAKKLSIEVGSQQVELDQSDVYMTNLMSKKEHLYGNLGQDVLNARKKYVLNLKDMYFQLQD